MKGSTVFCIVLWSLVVGAYFGKAKGLHDANFDRERANLKLQQCQDVIKNEKI
jgi:hypothetical protein